jgi:hypothetical protein
MQNLETTAYFSGQSPGMQHCDLARPLFVLQLNTIEHVKFANDFPHACPQLFGLLWRAASSAS